MLIRIIIILSSLALCAIVIYFINTDSGPVGFFKNYVASLFQSDADLDANRTNPVFDPVSENSMTMPFENAADSKYSKYRNGILVAKSNYIGFLTAESGIVWEKNTVVVNPILCAEGNYILLADKGSRKLCLYNRDKLLYSIETKDNIISARVSSNGDAIIIEEKDFYKGAVTVYNSNGEEIFAWNSGTDTILAADISDSSRRVAISLINTTDQISSNIIMFNIKETEHYASFQLADSIVFELNFLGETLHATSDNRIVGLSTRARLLWDITYDSQTLVHTALDGKGNRIVLLDDNNAAIIDYYSSSGRKRFTQNAADLPDFVDINGTNIVYNAGRSVICGRISSDSLRQFTASMDIHNLVLGDDGTVLIVYGNSLEFIKI